MSPLRTWSLILVATAAISACGGGGAQTAPEPASAPSARTDNTVSAQAIANSADQSIEKILANRVTGVTLGRASDGSLTVRIRGSTTWNPDQQPLYIIDGVPITPGPGGALAGINPYDIEKIEVLKDAGQTAMYGSRGANGVILIKTKRR
jgi:TonB-dependent SusC/RagA subfamily outer membrane receptor